MIDENNRRKVVIDLPKELSIRLEELAKKESHTVSQLVSIIIMNFFNDYSKILELVNENDFGVITEDNLRSFLKKSESKNGYFYKDIEHLSFDELFGFWTNKFLGK